MTVPEASRFFFVHLQKTGGTALFQRIRDFFGPAAVYPTPDDQGDVRAVTDVDYLSTRFRAVGDELRVVTGHFPLCTADLLDPQLRTFTVLRDPVERTLSLLRRRRIAETRFHGMELAEIYEHPALQDIIRNHMVKMLSLTQDEMTATPLTMAMTFDRARIDRAKRNLEQVEVVGLQEQFEGFCQDLEQRFGWDLGPSRFANRTPPSTVPESLRERIRADNEADVELYRFAVELHEERRRRVSHNG